MQDDEYLLVAACQSGDVAAFETLVRRYQDRTVRLLYLLVGNADDAQDLTQETFIRAFRCIRAFRQRSSFATWLHRIAVNTARNWVRDQKMEREALSLSDGTWRTNCPGPDDLLIAREKAMEIRAALIQLPQYYREAIVLRHFNDLSYEEIAEVQQVPVGTVRSRLAKGRQLMERYLSHGPGSFDRERMTNHDGLQEGKTTHSSRGGRSSW